MHLFLVSILNYFQCCHIFKCQIGRLVTHIKCPRKLFKVLIFESGLKHMPNTNEWSMGRCESKSGHQKDPIQNKANYMLKTWTNHSRCHNQHDLQNLYDHLITTHRISTLTMNSIFMQAPKIMRKVGTGTIWNFLESLYTPYPTRSGCGVDSSVRFKPTNLTLP